MRTDRSVSSSSLDFLNSDESSSQSDVLQQQFDTYTIHKESYDSFFSNLLHVVQQLSPQDVIDTFLQSNIRNKQLREAFETEDALKKVKLESKEELAKKIGYYEEEVTVIGEYI